MNEVLERHLIASINRRWSVLTSVDDILNNEMLLRTVASMAVDIILPCCCMLCNKDKLRLILSKTNLCCNHDELTEKLVVLVYDDLAKCNGLG